ncbi:MAG: GTP 3',8-cyclase MoaA [Gammaproteobacteria bacterium HGW-Gammaproteobacteria-4]|nr:MAG: GTP 3',8-cyclase MoaA [Gammaproteobacteria bacterium HGW-Gammaproteobacteria-4]
MNRSVAFTSPNTSEPVVVSDRLRRSLRDLRVSVIETCNYRCPYCMPADRTPEWTERDHASSANRLDFAEIETLVRCFARLGVSKVRLTGGEPLLRRGLPDLVARLAAIDGIDDLALTTNGSLLARQAKALADAGLHRLTVSLDTLDPERFSRLSGGRGKRDDVLAGIAAAEQAGFTAIKINCVVQRGVNDSDVLPLLAHFRGTSHVVRFIEYMDVGTCNRWQRTQVVPSAQLRDLIHARWPLRALEPNYRGEVASRYAYADGAGELGFVSSVTAPFCGDCHRARLGADGQLYTCLFAAGGTPLREFIAHGDAALTERIAATWVGRVDRYSELRGDVPGSEKRIEMFMVGG